MFEQPERDLSIEIAVEEAKYRHLRRQRALEAIDATLEMYHDAVVKLSAGLAAQAGAELEHSQMLIDHLHERIEVLEYVRRDRESQREDH